MILTGHVRWWAQERAAAFDAYLDDLTLATARATTMEVIEELIMCAGDTVAIIENELGAKVAAAKTR